MKTIHLLTTKLFYLAWKILSILFTLCILVVITSAQEPVQTIRGTVVDKDSRQPLVGATVMVVNGEAINGAVSDLEGRFKIEKVPVGRKVVKITYLGYKDAVLNDIIVNSAKEVVLNIELVENAVTAKEVTVNAKTDKAQANNTLVLVSGRSFTVDQTNRYAGSIGDPSRMAANFAGVAGGGNDQRNDIVIRGNTPLGLLWRLEGADIPNPNHFSNQGANGGPVSILNNNTLANSDFLTGAFPAEYGNATSGVFDLKIRNGNNEKHEFLGQIGFNGFEFMAEGPIKKDGASYLISYRYSTLSFFNALGIQFGNSGVPKFQDLTFKINMPKTSLGTFSVWGIGGLSSTQLLDSKKDLDARMKLAHPQDVDFSSKMGAAGVTHLITLGKKAYIKTTLSASGESNLTKVDSLTGEDLKDPFYLFHSNSSSGKIAVHSFLNKKINARNTLKTGVIISRLYGSSYDSVWIKQLDAFQSQLAFNAATYLGQAYVNWNYKINDELVLNSGLQYTHFFLNNTQAIEPRASIKWSFTPRQSIGFGYGLHSQIQPMITYYEKTLVDTPNRIYAYTNKNLALSKSQHFVLSYEYLPGDNIRLKVETYYQHLYDLPVTSNPGYFSTINTGADFGAPNVDSLVNKGIGYNTGLELTLERFFSKSYYFLFTASFYESKYRASDGVWRNTAFNGNYVLNALAGKEFTIRKNKLLAINLKITWAGGRRYVPVNEQESLAKGYAVYDEQHAYEKRLPDFFRTDIRVSYKINGKKVVQEWALDVQNVFNTQNVLTQQFNPHTGKMETLYQIGLFPVPLYRIYF